MCMLGRQSCWLVLLLTGIVVWPYAAGAGASKTTVSDKRIAARKETSSTAHTAQHAPCFTTATDTGWCSLNDFAPPPVSHDSASPSTSTRVNLSVHKLYSVEVDYLYLCCFDCYLVLADVGQAVLWRGKKGGCGAWRGRAWWGRGGSEAAGFQSQSLWLPMLDP